MAVVPTCELFSGPDLRTAQLCSVDAAGALLVWDMRALVVTQQLHDLTQQLNALVDTAGNKYAGPSRRRAS